VVSAAPNASAISRALGAAAWLPKPFDLDRLLDLVRPALPTGRDDSAIPARGPLPAGVEDFASR
jgi:hypothetical protein